MKKENLIKLIKQIEASGDVPSNIDELVEKAMLDDYLAYLSDNNLTSDEFSYLDFVILGMED